MRFFDEDIVAWVLGFALLSLIVLGAVIREFV